MTPEEIKACNPGDKVRVDGMVLTRDNHCWRSPRDRAYYSDPFSEPGVTVTRLSDPPPVVATDEEIVEEAERRYKADGRPMPGYGKTVGHHIIDIVREGWTPPPSIDPDLIEARKLATEEHPSFAAEIMRGDWDGRYAITIRLVAIKRGRELAGERS